MKTLVIVPTTKTFQEYFQSLPGFTLHRVLSNYDDLDIKVLEKNTKGICTLLEDTLNQEEYSRVVCIHDDVHLRDIRTYDIIKESFKTYDVIGLAGSAYQSYNSFEWTRWDTASQTRNHWGGFVAHTQKDGSITSNYFGLTPREVVVVDGLFMGFNSEKFRKLGVKLDQTFKFHHYDLDTCINCHKAGMIIGVIPLFVLHDSIGELDSNWEESAKLFFQKHKNKQYRV